MNVAEIKKCDIANGPGVRVSLFVSGCTHHCPGCFNEIAWDFDYGNPFTDEIQQELLTALAPSYIRGLTLLGGEPLERVNQQGLLPFLKKVCYTHLRRYFIAKETCYYESEESRCLQSRESKP
mgnify:CR=1 FL=1